jgi:hypothetical protein
LLFAFLVWRLSCEEESLSPFRMDFVLDDLDLDKTEAPSLVFAPRLP